MLRFLLGRLVGAALVLLVVSLVSFALIWIVPGDVASQIADPGATVEELQRIRQRLNLDQPWHEQMLAWYANLLRGDLGQSFLLNRGVTQAILERLPVTLSLTMLALLIAITLGVLAGVVAAVNHGRWADQGIMAAAISGWASSASTCSPWRLAGCRRAASCRSARACGAGPAPWRCPPSPSA
jgi:peptide/nickel transport system permease protein